MAKQAKQLGLNVVMGAPNVMLGYSHSNNVSARDAIREGLVDILCSDYYPPSLLQAVFFLHDQGMELPTTVKMVSLNPPKALGLHRYTGSIAVGKAADLLIVSREQRIPTVKKTFVNGHLVCRLDYRQQPGAAISSSINI